MKKKEKIENQDVENHKEGKFKGKKDFLTFKNRLNSLIV